MPGMPKCYLTKSRPSLFCIQWRVTRVRTVQCKEGFRLFQWAISSPQICPMSKAKGGQGHAHNKTRHGWDIT
jgi:hypothetical protein